MLNIGLLTLWICQWWQSVKTGDSNTEILMFFFSIIYTISRLAQISLFSIIIGTVILPKFMCLRKAIDFLSFLRILENKRWNNNADKF